MMDAREKGTVTAYWKALVRGVPVQRTSVYGIEELMAERKDPGAVRLGRKGGLAKVPKGLAKLSKKRRREIARQGAEARWGKKGEGKS